MKTRFRLFVLFSLLILGSFKIASANSGGPIDPLQAAYDVNYYDLDLSINHIAHTIGGSLLCQLEIIESIDTLLLDVDVPIRVNGVDTVVEMTDGIGLAAVSYNDDLEIDPKKWILMAQPSIITKVEDNTAIGREVRLEQNYPNPFEQNTFIKFSIPQQGHVHLAVYDIYGKEVAVLLDKELDAGHHQIQLDGNRLSEGTYFYRLQADYFIEAGKMVMIRD